MDKTNGYVFLWRRIVESLNGDGVAQAIMCQLLARVTHQAYHPTDGCLLSPGQVVLSLLQLSQYTGFARSTVWNALNRLEKRGTITRALAGRCGTVISLVNWKSYQAELEAGETVGGRQRFLRNDETVSLTRTKQEKGNSSSNSSPKKRSAKFDPEAWARGDYDTPDMGGFPG